MFLDDDDAMKDDAAMPAGSDDMGEKADDMGEKADDMTEGSDHMPAAEAPAHDDTM